MMSLVGTVPAKLMKQRAWFCLVDASSICQRTTIRGTQNLRSSHAHTAQPMLAHKADIGFCRAIPSSDFFYEEIVVRYHLFISHGQFYAGDSNLDWDPGEIWNEQTSADGVAVMPEALGILTIRYGGYVEITIEVADRRPEEWWEAWDQVVETSIALPSGSLQLSSPATDFASAPYITLEPGTYGVRVCYANLNAMADLLQKCAHDDQYSFLFYGDKNIVQQVSEATPYDYYHLNLWPASEQRLKIFKRYRWSF